MSRYGKIETGFWHNPKVRQLSEQGRFMLLYLLSCPHSNAAGCFVLPDGYIAADIGWGIETVSQTLSELFEKGLIERDSASNLTRIIGWWGHNAIENANVAKHIAKEITSLPNCEVRQRLIDDLLARTDLHQTVRQTLSERLGKPFRNQEPNLTQQEPNLSGDAEQPAPTEKPQKKDRRTATRFPEAMEARPESWRAAGLTDTEGPREFQKFKNHAGDKGRTSSNWRLAETNWYIKAAEFLGRKPPETLGTQPQVDWRKRMEFWAKSPVHDRSWFQKWGPAPDQAGCEVPRDLLIEFGAVAHETEAA